MIRAGLLLLLLMASACAPPQQAGCDIAVTRQIAFSTPGADDTIIARSFGAECGEAIVLYALTGADGGALWAWASPLARAFPHAAQDSDEMRAFLERWSAAQVGTTASAPAWTTLESDQTTLDQLTYEDIIARDLPMLCHFSGTAREACVFWEPAAGGAGLFFERDTETQEPGE